MSLGAHAAISTTAPEQNAHVLRVVPICISFPRISLSSLGARIFVLRLFTILLAPNLCIPPIRTSLSGAACSHCPIPQLASSYIEPMSWKWRPPLTNYGAFCVWNNKTCRWEFEELGNVLSALVLCWMFCECAQIMQPFLLWNFLWSQFFVKNLVKNLCLFFLSALTRQPASPLPSRSSLGEIPCGDREVFFLLALFTRALRPRFGRNFFLAAIMLRNLFFHWHALASCVLRVRVYAWVCMQEHRPKYSLLKSRPRFLFVSLFSDSIYIQEFCAAGPRGCCGGVQVGSWRICTNEMHIRACSPTCMQAWMTSCVNAHMCAP